MRWPPAWKSCPQRTLRGSCPRVFWRVTRLARTEGRFDAARGVQLTPYVGGEEEVALLLRRWELAQEGEGQIVILCGELGIGKIRILQELRERLASRSHTRLRYQCSPYHTHSAFHPFIAVLDVSSNRNTVRAMTVVSAETGE